MGGMWVEQEAPGHRRLRAVAGGDDIEAVEALFDELVEVVSAAPDDRWLVDLRGIMFVNSHALALLIACARKVLEAGGRLALINVHQFVATVLGTTRINRLIPVFEVEADALDHLA